MKIDECIINEKVIELIDELICYDDIYAAGTDTRAYAVATLGMVRGILDMAEALKGVIDA